MMLKRAAALLLTGSLLMSSAAAFAEDPSGGQEPAVVISGDVLPQQDTDAQAPALSPQAPPSVPAVDIQEGVLPDVQIDVPDGVQPTPADVQSAEAVPVEESEAVPEVETDEQQNADLQQLQDFITRLYEVVLGRGVDASGLAYWTSALVEGRKSGAEVAFGFAISD